jgi:DNA repair exonuclease SbcCD ATPase subunit
VSEPLTEENLDFLSRNRYATDIESRAAAEIRALRAERDALLGIIDEIKRDAKDDIPTRSATYVHALNTIIALKAELAAVRAEIAELSKAHDHQASRAERWRDEAKEAQQERDAARAEIERLKASLGLAYEYRNAEDAD